MVSRARQIFVGRAGIRAGWSALLFVLLLTACIFPLLYYFPEFNNIPKTVTPTFALLREGGVVLLILGATWVMGRIEHRSTWSYGLAGPRSVRNFAAGLAWGVLLLSLLAGILFAGGYLVFNGVALRGGAIFEYGLAWMFVFFLVGVAEETLFRGYLQSTLARGMGFWPAAICISVSFGLGHLRNEGEVFLGIVVAAIGGLVFNVCLRLSGSLWWGIGFHTAWDWAQSFLFGTPDSGYVVEGHLLSSQPAGDVRFSGGTAGPEGSLFFLPVLFVALFVIVFTLRRKVRDVAHAV